MERLPLCVGAAFVLVRDRQWRRRRSRAMREPVLRLAANSSDQPAFWKRIHENLRSVWMLPSAALTAAQAANGAPIHLLDQRREKTSFPAQAGSTCLHVLIFAVVIYAAIHPIDKSGANSLRSSFPLPTLRYTRPTQTTNTQTPSLSKAGSGGDHNPLPPTTSELATLCRFQPLCSTPTRRN